MKIKITPTNGIFEINKGNGGHPKKFVDAAKAIEFLERTVCGTHGLKTKTCVIVDYGDKYLNETMTSLDGSYLVWATSCLLEDFLSRRTLKRIEKKYRGLC